jgi:outer membrane protein OmpA-like peptidoglycan-associated protein
MSKHFLYFGLIGCALTVAGPSFAGPSKADLEKALSACPPGQSQGSDGLCAPSQGDSQMGYDFIPQGDAAPGAATTTTTTTTAHQNTARPVVRHTRMATATTPASAGTGLVDLQMTFANASSMLTDADKTTANTLTQVLMEPNNAEKLVEIGGHTNSVGNAGYNEELSQKRAEAVKQFLVANGVPADRLKAVGYGSSQPVQGSDPAAAENRRVMLTMLGTKQP